MAAASLLLGAILTFGTSDGERLQLTVSLTAPATVALSWDGMVRSSSAARQRHLFRDLPAPREHPLRYRLSVGREPGRVVEVAPLGGPDRLRVGVYGDSRDGDATHAVLIDRLERLAPEVVLHTGDVVGSADDRQGWVNHLASTLPLSARVPLLLSLGNHELQGRERSRALRWAMEQIPPPEDPLARALKVPLSVYHVRVGPVLFVSLDSNWPMGQGSEQYRFLEQALSERGDARHVFVCYHHGPISSGPHGPHPDAADIIALLERERVSLSISGHDHTYERIVRNGVAYLVSGGGGAPLYGREAWARGSQTFATTYNVVLLEVRGAEIELSAYSLEGVLLDRARLQPDPEVRRDRRTDGRGWIDLVVALSLLAMGFFYALARVTATR